jgi:hypothetical protein
MPAKMVPGFLQYRIAGARACARPRELADRGGCAAPHDARRRDRRPAARGRLRLACRLRRARDFEGAWKTLAPLRTPVRAPRIRAARGPAPVDPKRPDEALAVYQKALRNHPGYRALAYANLELMLQTGRNREALADLE